MHAPHPEPPRQPNLGDLPNCLEVTVREAEALESSVGSLPPVDENGESPCGFAEELYAKKEKLQRSLQGSFERLHDYIAIIKNEVAKLRKQQAVLRTERSRLHGDTAKDYYEEADHELELKCRAHAIQIDKIKAVIKLADAVLAKAVTKRFPGKIPEEWPGRLPPHEPTPFERLRSRLRDPLASWDSETMLQFEDQHHPTAPDTHRDPPRHVR